jgi:hypothetical protein
MVKTLGDELVQDFLEARSQSLDLAQDINELRKQGSQQRESDDEDSEMDRKLSPVDYYEPMDDLA